MNTARSTGPSRSSTARNANERVSSRSTRCAGIGVVVGQRLGEPGARVDLAVASRRSQRVDREPRRDRRCERLGPIDRLARERPFVQAQVRLLHDVLGLRHAAEHAVGDGEHERSEFAEFRGRGGHAPSMAQPDPSRGVTGCGAHPSEGVTGREGPHASLHRRRHGRRGIQVGAAARGRGPRGRRHVAQRRAPRRHRGGGGEGRRHGRPRRGIRAHSRARRAARRDRARAHRASAGSRPTSSTSTRGSPRTNALRTRAPTTCSPPRARPASADSSRRASRVGRTSAPAGR